jgi:hypothetical protein
MSDHTPECPQDFYEAFVDKQMSEFMRYVYLEPSDKELEKALSATTENELLTSLDPYGALEVLYPLQSLHTVISHMQAFYVHFVKEHMGEYERGEFITMFYNLLRIRCALMKPGRPSI